MFCSTRAVPHGLRRMPERRQHVLTVEIDHSRLIRLAGVDVYDT